MFFGGGGGKIFPCLAPFALSTSRLDRTLHALKQILYIACDVGGGEFIHFPPCRVLANGRIIIQHSHNEDGGVCHVKMGGRGCHVKMESVT